MSFSIGKARCKPAVDIAPFQKKHGYTAYIFTCEKTGESLSINVNAQCMNVHRYVVANVGIFTAAGSTVGYVSDIATGDVSGYPTRPSRMVNVDDTTYDATYLDERG